MFTSRLANWRYVMFGLIVALIMAAAISEFGGVFGRSRGVLRVLTPIQEEQAESFMHSYLLTPGLP